MSKVSAIIPARNEPYLQQTIDSLLNNAEGEIEVIAVLDGYWPEQPIKDDKRVVLIHNTEAQGMRSSINAAARIARGEYLMKTDAHCCFDKGFDVKLAQDCKPTWAMVPERYSLDINSWNRNSKKCSHEYIEKDTLKGRVWLKREFKTKDDRLSDLMTSQGSCWFMHLQRFFDIGCLDEDNHGGMGREAQEVCLKTWLSGGRYVLNRSTWYAHWSKPKEHVISDKKGKKKSVDYAVDLWMNDKWPMAKKTLGWLINRFAPVPTWDETSKDHSEFKFQKKPSDRIVNVIRKEGMNRTGLYKHFASLGFKIGAEIGVQRGRNAWVMLENIPGLKLYLIDPYKDNKDTQRQWGEKFHNKAYRVAYNRLKNHNVKFIMDYSLDASLKIPDNSLDFVYIDGEHSYDYVMMDILIWSRKVKTGGVVSGHDYHLVKTNKFKVEDAVNDYARAHNIAIYITDERAKELPGDGYASWFWIKK